MGAIERRTKQRAELRGAILTAARRVVLENGFRALTMRRIAEAVEYSPAAIYQYFESREAIAMALMEEGFEQLAVFIETHAVTGGPRERLEAATRAYIGFGLEHPETYRLMFMEDPTMTSALLSHEPKHEDAGTRAYTALIGPIAELRERNELRADLDVAAVADTLWSAMHGFVALKLTCPNFPATATDLLVPTLLRVLFDGSLKNST